MVTKNLTEVLGGEDKVTIEGIVTDMGVIINSFIDGVDIDAIVETGWYDIANAVNPAGNRVAFTLLVTNRINGSVINQQVFAEDEVFIRKSIDDGATWSAWIELAHTASPTFTGSVTVEPSSNTNALDFTASNIHYINATAANITVGTMATKLGQEGSITVYNAQNITGWGAEFYFAPDFSAVTKTPPASPTGTMEFWYKVIEIVGVNGGLANKIHIAWAK